MQWLSQCIVYEIYDFFKVLTGGTPKVLLGDPPFEVCQGILVPL
jgi:hypothetical protein